MRNWIFEFFDKLESRGPTQSFTLRDPFGTAPIGGAGGGDGGNARIGSDADASDKPADDGTFGLSSNISPSASLTDDGRTSSSSPPAPRFARGYMLDDGDSTSESTPSSRVFFSMRGLGSGTTGGRIESNRRRNAPGTCIRNCGARRNRGRRPRIVTTAPATRDPSPRPRRGCRAYRAGWFGAPSWCTRLGIRRDTAARECRCLDFPPSCETGGPPSRGITEYFSSWKMMEGPGRRNWIWASPTRESPHRPGGGTLEPLSGRRGPFLPPPPSPKNNGVDNQSPLRSDEHRTRNHLLARLATGGDATEGNRPAPPPIERPRSRRRSGTPGGSFACPPRPFCTMSTGKATTVAYPSHHPLTLPKERRDASSRGTSGRRAGRGRSSNWTSTGGSQRASIARARATEFFQFSILNFACFDPPDGKIIAPAMSPRFGNVRLSHGPRRRPFGTARIPRKGGGPRGSD